jgi:hypothetical protein
LTGAQHAALLAQNANVTFTLGNQTAGVNVNITLPYSAFDLNVSSPIVPESTSYFPLKRASNSTQYTLGRTFFQEAYVTADYDRRTFSVSQCAWVAGAQQKIVPILPPTQDTGSGTESPAGSQANSLAKSKSSVPVAAIGGGVAGGVGLLIIIGILVYCFCIKPRRKKAAAAQAEVKASEAAAFAAANAKADPMFLKPELDNSEIQRAQELGNNKDVQRPHELEDQEMEHRKRIWAVEAGGSQRFIYELDGKRGVWAVEADGQPVEVFEMPAAEEVAHEMRGQRDSLEIAPPRPQRWSWETSAGSETVVGSSTTSPEMSTVSPGSLAKETSPRSWQARLASLPESSIIPPERGPTSPPARPRRQRRPR